MKLVPIKNIAGICIPSGPAEVTLRRDLAVVVDRRSGERTVVLDREQIVRPKLHAPAYLTRLEESK